jgi:hypothetical protein
MKADVPAPLGARLRRRIAEAGTAALGGAAIAAMAYANQAWFDRHFLPVYFLPQSAYHLGETIARLVVAGLGLAVLLWAPPIAGRAAAGATLPSALAGLLRMLLALVLGLAVSEAALRIVFPRAGQETPPGDEPLRRRDGRLGWVFQPARIGHARLGGRAVEYAIDPSGYRVRGLAAPVDPARPSILFAGESIMVGKGLAWPETIPARVADAFGDQPANLAVFAYGDDQVAMRIAQELPRFARPRALVILFSPGLVFRDFDDERPHLGPGLVWRPAVDRSRLLALIRFFVPYHGKAEIDRTLVLVREELRRSIAAAGARGAPALVVVPQFEPADPLEAGIRRRVLDEGAIPYVLVPLDPRMRIAKDTHPNAQAARQIADAVVGRLRAMGVRPKPASAFPSPSAR